MADLADNTPLEPEVPASEAKVPHSGEGQPARGLDLHKPMLLASALLVGWYWGTFEHWRLQWSANDYYAHAPLIPVLTAVIIWARRGRLTEARVRPWLWGLPILLMGGLLKLSSTWMSATGVDAFASVSFPVVLWGLLLTLYGPEVAGVLAAPAAFLLFMCPLPGYVVAELSFPLQMTSTTAGATLASLLGVNLYQQGTTILLSSLSLFVDVACSGFKSVLSLLALSSFAALTSRLTLGKKLILIASALPIGLVTNALRIAAITVAADRGGQATAIRVHDTSGLLVLGLACASVLLLAKVLGWLDNTDTW